MIHANHRKRWEKWYHDPMRERARREAKETELDPDMITLAHASFMEFVTAKRAGRLPDYELTDGYRGRTWQP